MKRLITKRFILVFIFIVLLDLNHTAFAAEELGNFTGNAGLSIFFEADSSVAEKVLESIILSSLTLGLGGHLNVIPYILAPGIYGDAHISIASLFDLMDEDKNSSYIREKSLFFQVGLRLYNQFRFGPIDIQPFAGLNLMAGKKDTMGLKALGILVAYKNAGLEYSYQLPIKNAMDDRTNAIHRFALLYHMR